MNIAIQAVHKMTVRLAVSAGSVFSAAPAPAAAVEPPQLARARAAARPTPKTISVRETIATSWDDRAVVDPASIPRSVPNSWVDELNAIRRIERAAAFDGYYDQD